MFKAAGWVFEAARCETRKYSFLRYKSRFVTFLFRFFPLFLQLDLLPWCLHLGRAVVPPAGAIPVDVSGALSEGESFVLAVNPAHAVLQAERVLLGADTLIRAGAVGVVAGAGAAHVAKTLAGGLACTVETKY